MSLVHGAGYYHCQSIWLTAEEPGLAVGSGQRAAGTVRIFDFDDGGYSPPIFDVANARYMVLFDERTSGRTGVFDRFRECFVGGYVAESGFPATDEAVDRFIDLPVDALTAGIDDPAHAPVGIQTASPTWPPTLRGGDHHRRSGR